MVAAIVLSGVYLYPLITEALLAASPSATIGSTMAGVMGITASAITADKLVEIVPIYLKRIGYNLVQGFSEIKEFCGNIIEKLNNRDLNETKEMSEPNGVVIEEILDEKGNIQNLGARTSSNLDIATETNSNGELSKARSNETQVTIDVLDNVPKIQQNSDSNGSLLESFSDNGIPEGKQSSNGSKESSPSTSLRSSSFSSVKEAPEILIHST